MSLFDSPSDDVQLINFDEEDAAESIESVNFIQLAGAARHGQPHGLANVPSVPKAGEHAHLGERSSFVEDAEAHLDARLQASFEDGYREGLAEGQAQAEQMAAQLDERVDAAMRHALDQLAALERACDARVRQVSVVLGRAFAEQILARELRDHDGLFDVATDAIRRASGLGKITVNAHPDAVEMLEEHLDMLRRMHPDGSGVVLQSDPTLDYGDLRLMAEGGQIESVLEDRLDRLAARAEFEMAEDPSVGLGDEATSPLDTASGPDEVL
ncbi:hypothetical protein FIV42_11440 [Persicimonas caeni]|uniref:Flagellar assembly protein FliH/Type III secretion system HrpE domain-containing protein n=1 Tax=Persicimonas caeni TaxID=2292766 RepID=A0A4Y6PSM3_PERCE|nr:FliH/SctL family protein [Persicimonas caeni]QDG51331.1 hypothetical protein FIV42_11440 [Persicimonas caeni]QED32552.1 hypothetical protein FRD00_11435 [Persicimonas caeni]